MHSCTSGAHLTQLNTLANDALFLSFATQEAAEEAATSAGNPPAGAPADIATAASLPALRAVVERRLPAVEPVAIAAALHWLSTRLPLARLSHAERAEADALAYLLLEAARAQAPRWATGAGLMQHCIASVVFRSYLWCCAILSFVPRPMQKASTSQAQEHLQPVPIAPS